MCNHFGPQRTGKGPFDSPIWSDFLGGYDGESFWNPSPTHGWKLSIFHCFFPAFFHVRCQTQGAAKVHLIVVTKLCHLRLPPHTEAQRRIGPFSVLETPLLSEFRLFLRCPDLQYESTFLAPPGERCGAIFCRPIFVHIFALYVWAVIWGGAKLKGVPTMKCKL